MSNYAAYPSLQASSIPERASYFKGSVLSHLQKGVSPEMALAVAKDALEREDYEMVQGIEEAVKDFRANPQLSFL